MIAERRGRLDSLAEIIRQFHLTALGPSVRACETLSVEGLIDVAVLGQFKSGKSSLLNAVLGEPVFPVGVVPVTTVITRAAAGPERVVRVTFQDGSHEEVAPHRLAEFVTESGNPGNRRQVAVVDVFTPALENWPGMRLVDTPGLGSVFAHNTEATRNWMPNVAVALITVSAERPLSDEDGRLIGEAGQAAPRVVVVLTKADLLTNDELREVTEFVDRALRESYGDAPPVLPFSSRVEPERWVRRLREAVLQPVIENVNQEKSLALDLKLASLRSACRDYLSVGLQAAERNDADRDKLRAAVFTETVNAAMIRDELRLAEERVCAGTWSTFTGFFLAQRATVEQRVIEALAADLPNWNGNLAGQARQYEGWMAERLIAELTPLSQNAAPLAAELLHRVEERFRRIVEAFRDRIARNIQIATGVVVSPAAWEVKRPRLAAAPVALGPTFMTHWDLLWWLLPMRLVGGLFRRHVLRRVGWEVEKNLFRLAGSWTETVNRAAAELRSQATSGVDTELVTLDRLLRKRKAEAAAFHEALRRLEEMEYGNRRCT